MPLYRSALSPASPTLTGTTTFSGAQGNVIVNTTSSYTVPTILVSGEGGGAHQLTMAPGATDTLLLGTNAQPNLAAAVLYIRPQGTFAALAIENVAGNVELYRIDYAGNHTVGTGCNFTFNTSPTAPTPSGGDNSTKVATTAYAVKKSISYAPTLIALCGGL